MSLDIFANFQRRRAVEIWVMGHSRSSKMASLDRLHTLSYLCSIVNYECNLHVCLPDLSENANPNTHRPYLTPRWGDPVGILTKFGRMGLQRARRFDITICFSVLTHYTKTVSDRPTDRQGLRQTFRRLLYKTTLCKTSRDKKLKTRRADSA